MKDLEEANAWQSGARKTFEDDSLGRERFTVAVAMAIHASIKANDALTMKFLNRRSTRHDDAALLFGDLVRQRKIQGKYAGYRDLLKRGAAQKSNFDYKGEGVGKDQAVRWLRDVERFIAAVAEILQT